MAKKKKNSNYATEKRANAASERESREKALALKNKILAIVIPSIILVAISVVLTLISGLIPSRSAAKKDPVVALRTE